jgi:hypothetical protein
VGEPDAAAGARGNKRTGNYSGDSPRHVHWWGNLDTEAMNLTVEIPDDLAARLRAGGGDLSRRALEALAAEEYKHDRLTKPELQRLLGIETSFQLDEFLKAHDVWIEYTREDAEREIEGLKRLGF